jgi:hypothetical protein
MRDRDIRINIKERLEDTDAIQGVFLSGLPENYGFGTNIQTAAVIEPVSWNEDDKWDAQPTGDLIIDSQVTITFMARDESPEVRDAAVESLLDVAANALNGRSLAGLTLPPFTKFVSGRWEKAKDVERRVTSTFKYRYLVPGWNQFDTSE